VTLTQELDRLWEIVNDLERPIVAARKPGIAREQAEATFGHAVPDDVAAWYSYSDGIAYAGGQSQDDASLVPGFWPLSAIEAQAIRQEIADLDEPLLSPKWIPLLANGGGDLYVATFAGREVLHIATLSADLDVSVVFKRIEEMVSGFCELYRRGVFFVADDGSLEADDDQWEAFEAGPAFGDSTSSA